MSDTTAVDSHEMMDKVVFVLASVLFLTPDQFQGKRLSIEELESITEECLSESNLDRAVLNRAFRRQKLPSYDSKYAKHLLCSYKKQGYVDDKGNIIVFDQMKEYLDDNDEKNYLDKAKVACESEQKGETQEEKTYAVAKCLIDYLHHIKPAKKVEENRNL